jgi:hypothetical protein
MRGDREKREERRDEKGRRREDKERRVGIPVASAKAFILS